MKRTRKYAVPVNQGRHSAQCAICKHDRRLEIEEEFLAWKSPQKIAKDYGICRDGIYRHARAFKLLEPRRQNVKAALEKIIERAGDVPVNATAVVSAVAAYSKLNAQGQWIDRRETLDLNAMFERMTQEELQCYAARGELPEWFSVATDTDSQRRDLDR